MTARDVPVRQPAPDVPVEVTGRELDRDVRDELRTLSAENADRVARHLVMVGRLIDEDPLAAYEHAKAAQRTAARVASVRETCGLAAYAAGRYAEALAELRAARRMSGSQAQLPVMADCERGLGRPERALALATSADANRLDRGGQIELRIVASGARRDLGQAEAAVVTLQVRELGERKVQPWSARLRYAYADALVAVGRVPEALQWFARAAEADTDGATDADERLAELEGISFVDALDGDAEEQLQANAGKEAVPEPTRVGAGSPAPPPSDVNDANNDAAVRATATGSEVLGDSGDSSTAARVPEAGVPAYGAGLFQEPAKAERSGSGDDSIERGDGSQS